MKREEVLEKARVVMQDVMDRFDFDYEVYTDVKTKDIIHALLIGSVREITPSGKSFYAPIPCEKCRGKGCSYCGNTGSRERYEDQVFIDELDRIAQLNDYTVSGDYGDPCELYLEKIELRFGSVASPGARRHMICRKCGEIVDTLSGGVDGNGGIRCTECEEIFCDNCYDTGLGDGCHCHA